MRLLTLAATLPCLVRFCEASLRSRDLTREDVQLWGRLLKVGEDSLSFAPTNAPTPQVLSSTSNPTMPPSALGPSPTSLPTGGPTDTPTDSPTSQPTAAPDLPVVPTDGPTELPTASPPAADPTSLPTSLPTVSSAAPSFGLQQATCSAIGWGDPHFVTFDGLKYDCQADGEVILLQSLDSELEIQARFTKVGFPSVTTAVVIREVGDLPTVQVSMATRPGAENTFAGCPVEVYIDGTLVPFDELGGTTGVEFSEINSYTLHVFYPSTSLAVTMSALKYGVCYFTVDYDLSAGCRGGEQIVGMLGSPNDDPSDDWMAPNGTSFELPAAASEFSFATAFEYCTTVWCMRNESQSLFTYEAETSFDDFENCDGFYDSSLEASVTNAPQWLVDLCGGDVGCIIDGLTLGRGAAEAYLDTVNAEPCVPQGEPKACYFSCTEAAVVTCDSTPGIVSLCPDPNQTIPVYCDQETDNGGWMLTWSYRHLAGGNAELVRGEVPFDPVNDYSHFFVNQIPGYAVEDIESVRFNCTTSGHDRVMTFKNSHPSVIQAAFDGNYVPNPAAWNLADFSTELSGHTALLPAATDSGFASSNGFDNFPFFTSRIRHWAVRGFFNGQFRWECDDISPGGDGGINRNSTHNVWVRMKS